MDQGQQQGAILLTWEGAQPSQPHTAPTVLQESTRYMEQLRNNGDIVNYRIFVNITDSGGFSIIEGEVNNLIDLVKDPDYRQWLLTCQLAFDKFRVVTAVGGTDTQVESVLAQQQQAYQQTQQVAQQFQANRVTDQSPQRHGNRRFTLQNS